MSSSVITIIIFFHFIKLLWLREEVTLFFIISKLVTLFIVTSLVLAGGIFVAKYFAISKGYTATYYSWKNGLLIGFVLSFITYGFLPIIFPGNLIMNRIERHRHGKLYPGENLHEIKWMIIFTELALFFIAIFSSLFYFTTHISLFYYFMTIASLIAFFSLLPFNNNLGLHFFHANRMLYFFFLFFSFFLALFLMLRMYYALILSLASVMIVYFLTKKLLRKVFA